MIEWIRGIGLLFISLVHVGCAGNGTGLDEFGQPLTPEGLPPLEATLSSIQANILTAICTQCHTGVTPPLGLALNAGVSRQNLVGVPSVGVPEVQRNKPGNPDESYMVWKLEGRSGITGDRMPLGLEPLRPEEIAAIREWIQDGALDN